MTEKTELYAFPGDYNIAGETVGVKLEGDEMKLYGSELAVLRMFHRCHHYPGARTGVDENGMFFACKDWHRKG